jgi:DmsE family decaheme c-type cytochrome
MGSLLISVLTWWMTAAAAAQAPESPPATQAEVMSVDFTQCAACHDIQIAGMGRTSHAKLPNNCANCHSGDFEAHMESGDPTLVVTPTELPPREASSTCFQCHDQNVSNAHWKGSVHDRRGVSCVNCHSVHSFKSTASQLKTVRESDTCYSCHKATRAQAMRQSHHPIREGKMECADCHNPHGTPTPRLIKADSVNELCYKCHSDKRGPFLWEHAPARENCTYCHQPHGSNTERLLVAKQPYLCQRCHLNTRHPGTLYDFRNTTLGPNPSNRLIEHGCRNCHQWVHGTNHPSGPYLGR